MQALVSRDRAYTMRGELRTSEPMSAHTSWRVGGPADSWYRPADLEDLQGFLGSLPDSESIYWIGLGSNLLVRDGGIRGTVILPFGGLNELVSTASDCLYAGAGVACAKVARFAAREGLSGCEFLAGIPGTMGGALAMNAGAFGGETWPLVRSVNTVDRHGQVYRRLPEEYDIAYRQVSGPQCEWFTGVELKLCRDDATDAQRSIRSLLEKRSATQPTSQPSCGSVFLNPPGDHAARLIEAAGLKGKCIGGARVSEKHANFIINQGNARAVDIENLIGFVRDEVERSQGVRLHTEVRVIGEHR